MGAISAKLKQDINHLEFQAKHGRGTGLEQVFSSLDSTQKAVEALEDRLLALESRLQTTESAPNI